MAESSTATGRTPLKNSLLQEALSAWSQSTRLLRLHTPLGPDVFLVESMKGLQDLQGGDSFIVNALSTDARINIKQLLNQPVLLELLTAHSRTQLRPFHGHITRAVSTGANGGMARYQFRIEPWLTYLHYRTDSTPYQDMTVMEILDSVFSDYQAGRGLPNGTLNPQWRYALADSSVYPRRSITTQYQESDWAFVQRLMHEEGLFCWWEYQGDPSQAPYGHHTLVIADHNGAFQPNAQDPMPFKQMSTVIKEDSLDHWRHRVRGVPTALTLHSWDYRQHRLRSVNAEAPQANPESPSQPELVAPYYSLPRMEIEDTPVAYAFETDAQGQRLAQRQLEALLASSQQFTGAGSVRTCSPGTTFTLTSHATDMQATPLLITKVVHQAYNNLNADLQLEIAHQLGIQQGAATGHVDHQGLEPKLEEQLRQHQDLSNLTSARLHHTLSDSQQQAGERALYRNRIECIPLATPWRNPVSDEHHTLFYPKPTVKGQQTAIVVGPEGHVIHTDRDHRVKLQYHWQRASAPDHQGQNRLTHPSPEGHTGAPANEKSGTWVRVLANLAPVAGQNWGSVAIPRIGQEVMVDFIEGDIDRPVIIGSLYNGQGRDNAQGNQTPYGAGKATGNAPAWFPGSEGAHAHAAVFSGLKTQSLETSQTGQGAYNQLVFDDTPQQGRINLQQHKHTQSISQLNLGHLYYQQDNQRHHPTGYGTELATHHALAIRAGQGLLISTDQRLDATTGQLDSREAHAIIEHALAVQRTLADNAQQHRITLKQAKEDPTAKDTHNSIAAHQRTLDAIRSQAVGVRQDESAREEHITAYSQPNIHFSSPAGIVSTTPNSTIVTAGGHSSLTAQHDISFATQGTYSHIAEHGLRFFTHGQHDKTQTPNKPVTETGIRLHAAKGRVEVHSQSGALNIHAEKNVNVTSVNNAIHMRSPKRIQFYCGGASLKFEGNNIEIVAPAGFKMMAAKKVLKGPKGGRANVEHFKVSALNHPTAYSGVMDAYDIFHRVDMSKVNYAAKRANGEVVYGKLKQEGKTDRVYTEKPELVEVLVGADGPWAVIGDDGDVRNNIGEAHHDEDDAL